MEPLHCEVRGILTFGADSYENSKIVLQSITYNDGYYVDTTHHTFDIFLGGGGVFTVFICYLTN